MKIWRIWHSNLIFSEKQPAFLKHRRSSLLLCSLVGVLGIFLTFFAFPGLAHGFGGFVLEANGPDMVRPGDSLVYTVRYQNIGWPLLTNVVLFGQLPEYTSFVSASPECQLQGEIIICSAGTLSYGEGGEIETILRVDQDAPAGAVISSKVIAAGQEPEQKPMFLNSVHGYTKVVVPELLVKKQASTNVVYAGEPVTYTYEVLNAGDVALTDIVINDDHKSPPQVCDSLPLLEPGDSFTCTWTTALNADTTNLATAIGYDPWGDPVMAAASAFVNTIQMPGPDGSGIISVEKIASKEAVYAGETVVYTYTVTNLSDDSVHDISLIDDKLGVIAPSFDLGATQSAIFAASAEITADTTNVAVAEGRNLLGDVVQAQASAFVSVIAPDITLDFALDASAILVYEGDTVTYTYTVSNTGTGTAYAVMLTDDQLGVIAGPFDLAGGEGAVFTASQRLDQDRTSIATVTGEDQFKRPAVEITVTLFVDTIQRPGPNGEGILSLEVIPDATDVEAGTIVTYAYIVTNMSNDPVFNIVVQDNQFGIITSLEEVHTLDTYDGFTLQGGQSRTQTIAMPLYQSLWNEVTATGQDLLQTAVSAEAETFVNVWTGEPQQYVMFLPIVFGSNP